MLRLEEKIMASEQADTVNTNALLEATNTILLNSLNGVSEEEVARKCLAVAEELTGSKFGFIQEINPNGRLDTVAISNPGWDACTIPKDNAVALTKDMKIRGIRKKVLESERPLIVNDPASHPDWRGLPEGHPEITCFLGVPLKRAGETIGLIGLANKESGYELSDAKAVEKLSISFVQTLYRKRAEEELRKSEERYKELIDKMSSALAVHEAKDNGEDFVIKDFNRAGERIGKVKKEKILGKSALEVFPGLKESGLLDAFQRVWRTGKPEQRPLFLYNDNKISLWMNSYIYKLSSGEVAALYEDVTERIRTDNALREIERKYRTLVDNVPQKIFLKDRDGVYISANKTYARDLGIGPEEIAGKTDYDFYPRELAEKYRSDDKRIIETGRTEEIEETYAQGGKWYWIHTVKIPVLNEQGIIDRVLGVFWDITEHKQAEEKLKRTMENLERSNDDLQKFAYVASHDLQEPLRMVTSYCQLLEKRYKGKLDKEGDEFIAFAVDGAARMQVLISDLLEYSRTGTQDKSFESIDSSAVVRQVLKNLEPMINKNDAVITMDELPLIIADEIQIMRLLQNLIGNAIKFRGEKSPVIHIGAKRDRNEWVFSVKDNGIGIAPEFYDRIFQIFQRLHPHSEYDGTGIGLAICKKIIGRHGGRIWVESELGKGSTFHFTIPVRGDKHYEHEQ